MLHEEVLRGIHMLSVANLRPGGEVEIVTRWAATLAFVEGKGQLRIPLTAGDVYGWSGLADTDELVTGGRTGQRAQLRIRNADGPVTVAGVRLIDGQAEIGLDRPIDIAVPGWAAASLVGRAADGRRVELTVTPAPAGATRAAIAMLVDVSGSMGERFTSARALMTNHSAAKAVVRDVAAALGEGDALDLWEFSTAVRHVGTLSHFDGGSIDGLLDRVSSPGGGTETGRAVETVAAGSDTRDILLITDGKSHALDVQKLAGLGRRVSVLLIGEDSLEANVGHLAALTGGELFIASEANLASVARAMTAAIRTPYLQPEPIAGQPDTLLARRGGVTITARWTDAAAPAEPVAGVSAVAAALAVTAMGTERAAALAESEGLVTHLTSLVLVDQAGSVQEGVPSIRKIALERSAVAGGSASGGGCQDDPEPWQE